MKKVIAPSQCQKTTKKANCKKTVGGDHNKKTPLKLHKYIFYSHMVLRLGFLVFTQAARVRHPVWERNTFYFYFGNNSGFSVVYPYVRLRGMTSKGDNNFKN